jgi:hypothetical protein
MILNMIFVCENFTLISNNLIFYIFELGALL